MKLQDLTALDTYLRMRGPKEALAPFYLVLAQDAYDRDVIRSGIVETARRLHGSELAVAQMNCGKKEFASAAAMAQLEDELQVLGLFAAMRLLILTSIDAMPREGIKLLTAYLKRPSPLLCVVAIVEGAKGEGKSAAPVPNKTFSAFQGIVEDIGVVVDLPQPKPWERDQALAHWLQAEAGIHRKWMHPKACQALINAVGHDKYTLHQEVEKLSCYCGERQTIAAEDVAALCTAMPHDTIWQLGEALFNFDVHAALRIARGLEREDNAAIGMVAQLRYQMQSAYRLLSMAESGIPHQDISKEMPHMKGSILQKNMDNARRYGEKRLANALICLYATEQELKSSQTPPGLAVEKMIIELARR